MADNLFFIMDGLPKPKGGSVGAKRGAQRSLNGRALLTILLRPYLWWGSIEKQVNYRVGKHDQCQANDQTQDGKDALLAKDEQ
jgi:hypothetical protein